MLKNCLFVYLCQNLGAEEIKLIGLSFPMASFQERVWCLISSVSAVKPCMIFLSQEGLTEFAQLTLGFLRASNAALPHSNPGSASFSN